MFAPLWLGRELNFANRHCESWTAARICDSWTPYTGTSYYATGSLWPDSYAWGGRHSLYYCQSAGLPLAERFRITPDPAVYPELFHYGRHRMFAALRWHPGSGWEAGSSEYLSLIVGATAVPGKQVHNINQWSPIGVRFLTASGGGWTPTWVGSQAVDIVFYGRSSVNSAARGFVDDLIVGLDWLTIYPHLRMRETINRTTTIHRAMDGTARQVNVLGARRWTLPVDIVTTATWLLISSWYLTGAPLAILDPGCDYDCGGDLFTLNQVDSICGLYRAKIANRSNPMETVVPGHPYLRFGTLELVENREVM